jgi:hypothetical protein
LYVLVSITDSKLFNHQHTRELLTDSNRLANITTYQQTAAGMNHPLQG